MTEPIDLDAIRARADAATPGPWGHDPEGNMGCGSVYTANEDLFGGNIAEPSGDLYPRGGYDPKADMVFIAHARTDVPALLAEVDRLRAALDTPSLLDVYTAEIATLRADVQRLTAHSVTLNAIGFRLAEALGRVRDGADSVVGNPTRDLETLIAERDLHSRQRDAMRPVVEAAATSITDPESVQKWADLGVAVDAYTAAAPAQRAQDGPTDPPEGERTAEGAPDAQAGAERLGITCGCSLVDVGNGTFHEYRLGRVDPQCPIHGARRPA